MADEALQDNAGAAEFQLSVSWSIGPLRPWLKMIAERELPVSFRGRVEASDIVQETLLDAWAAYEDFAARRKQNAWPGCA